MGPAAGMTRFESIDWYDTPHYYDIIVDAGTTVECDFLESERRAARRRADLAAPPIGSLVTAIDSPVASPLHFGR